MSIINQVGNNIARTASQIISNEIKMSEIKEIDQSKIVIISSRKLTDEEDACLEQHGGSFDWDERYKTMSIDELFTQKKVRFIVFELPDNDDAEFIGSNYKELKNFPVILVKSSYEDDHAKWLTQFTEDEDFKHVSILETMNFPSLIKDSDYLKQVLYYHKVIQPDGCCMTIVHFLKDLQN